MHARRWCSKILATCGARHRASKVRKIKQSINSRYMQLLVAKEDQSSTSAYFRRATWEGYPTTAHVQVDLPNGGASTDPDTIKAGVMTAMVDFFLARKGPPEEGAPLPPHIEVYYPPAIATTEVALALSWKEFAVSLLHTPANCPGPTGISAPLLKALPGEFLHGLWRLSNLCLLWGVLPALYNRCHIYPIPKKGTPSLSNSRPIALLELMLKVVTRAVNWRLMNALRGSRILLPPPVRIPSRSLID